MKQSMEQSMEQSVWNSPWNPSGTVHMEQSMELHGHSIPFHSQSPYFSHFSKV